MALPKIHRLKQRQQFGAVYQLGIKRTTPHLTLRALSPQGSTKKKAELSASVVFEDTPPTQIGISVSQKVSKRAVIRNRIKRQIRSALRHFLPQLAPGWQLVIVVKPSAIQCDYEDFLRELEQLLMNAEVLNGHQGRSLL